MRIQILLFGKYNDILRKTNKIYRFSIK